METIAVIDFETTGISPAQGTLRNAMIAAAMWLSEIDLGHCANCGGVLKIIAASQEQPAIDSCRASRRGMAVKG